jgi:hypothetical protein
MIFIQSAIKNEMLVANSEGDYKKEILDFIKTLTTKIYEEPSLVSLLFTDSRGGDKKGQFIPLQILLILLTREDINENDKNKLMIRETILMYLKLNN